MSASLKTGTYYERYRAAATRFELIGGVLLGAGVLLDYASGQALRSLAILLACIGAILLLIGGSSLRPHNQIKAFAQQCAADPCDDMAKGLLQALEQEKTVPLMQKNLDSVQLAIEIYSGVVDADETLITRLREAAATHLKRKRF